jgi:hypothetical protein
MVNVVGECVHRVQTGVHRVQSGVHRVQSGVFYFDLIKIWQNVQLATNV